VFAHVILGRLQPLLHRQQRPQQSGFTAGRSTADAILALRLLSELYREFSKPLHVAYLDIKAAFDSVDREALWKALRAKHVPQFLISLFKNMYTGTKSCVRVDRSCTASFPTSSGVRQGCVLAQALFRIALNWIMSICADKAGVNVGQSLFTDIHYADDAVLFAEDDVQWPHPHPSIQLRTLWASTYPRQKLKFKMLPSDHNHLPVPYQDIKWKRRCR